MMIRGCDRGAEHMSYHLSSVRGLVCFVSRPPLSVAMPPSSSMISRAIRAAKLEFHSTEVLCARAADLESSKQSRLPIDEPKRANDGDVRFREAVTFAHDRRVMALCLLLRPNASLCPPSPPIFLDCLGHSDTPSTLWKCEYWV